MLISDDNEFWTIWAAQDEFSGREFSEIDCNVDLSKLNLSKSCFRNSKFYDMTASDANWSNAILEKVVFDSCDLSSVDFTSLNAKSVTFIKCDLDGAIFNKSVMEKLEMRSCTGEISMEDTYAPNSMLIDCDFAASSFDDSDLRDSIFTRSILEAASFTKSTLDRCLFSLSLITDAEIFSAKSKTSVSLNRAIIYPVSALETELSTETSSTSYTPAGWGTGSSYNNYPNYTPLVPKLPATLYCSNEEELTL